MTKTTITMITRIFPSYVLSRFSMNYRTWEMVVIPVMVVNSSKWNETIGGTSRGPPLLVTEPKETATT